MPVKIILLNKDWSKTLIFSMIYNNKSIKRQDHLLEEQSARRILEEGAFGFLAMQAEEGGGYGVPVSYAWDGDNAIYILSDQEGRKLDCITRSNKVSFCVVGEAEVPPGNFATCHESIVLQCIAESVSSKDEKLHALGLLIRKYSSEYLKVERSSADSAADKAEILRLEIRFWSGKVELKV